MPIEAIIPSPLLVWEIFPRLLGVVYFIALAQLYRQVLPIAGSRGFAPAGRMLRQIRVDLAGRERFEQALNEQSLVESEARQLSPALGAWLWGEFRFEIMAAQCRAFDMARSMLALDWKPGTPAFAAIGRFLADQHLEQPPHGRLALTRASDTGLWNVQVEPAESYAEREVLAA